MMPCRCVCQPTGYTFSDLHSVSRIRGRRGTPIYSNGAEESSIRPGAPGAPRARAAASKTAGHQRLISQRFHDRTRRWEEVYQRDDLFSVIHQDRQARALDWIDGLGLPPRSPVLEVGPGAGFMTVALAQREFAVHAADTTPRLLDVARQRVAAAGLESRARLLLADAHHLPFADREFALVVALGVVPWLRSAPVAVAEMARVLRPGGYLVLNADNSGRLALLLDPRRNPALAPARLAAKSLLHSTGVLQPAEQARVTAHRLAGFDALLSRAGLELLKRSTFGFGPFTMFGLPVASGRLGIRLNTSLQRLADQGVPGFRSAGAQYLVLARAPLAAGQPAAAAEAVAAAGTGAGEGVAAGPASGESVTAGEAASPLLDHSQTGPAGESAPAGPASGEGRAARGTASAF